jgi:hypothetical protein
MILPEGTFHPDKEGYLRLNGAVKPAVLGDDAGTFVYHENYSLRAGVDIAHMRYFEISLFRVKQRHDKDWDDLVRLVMNAYERYRTRTGRHFKPFMARRRVRFLCLAP